MSRSKRKASILHNGKAPSEKDKKQKANRKLRRIVKEKSAVTEEELPQIKRSFRSLELGKRR